MKPDIFLMSRFFKNKYCLYTYLAVCLRGSSIAKYEFIEFATHQMRFSSSKCTKLTTLLFLLYFFAQVRALQTHAFSMQVIEQTTSGLDAAVRTALHPGWQLLRPND